MSCEIEEEELPIFPGMFFFYAKKAFCSLAPSSSTAGISVPESAISFQPKNSTTTDWLLQKGRDRKLTNKGRRYKNKIFPVSFPFSTRPNSLLLKSAD